jgi:hypothetical protein
VPHLTISSKLLVPEPFGGFELTLPFQTCTTPSMPAEYQRSGVPVTSACTKQLIAAWWPALPLLTPPAAADVPVLEVTRSWNMGAALLPGGCPSVAAAAVFSRRRYALNSSLQQHNDQSTMLDVK